MNYVKENAARALLTFEPDRDKTFVARPQRLFKPMGLMLWGAPSLSTVRIMIGTKLQAVVSYPDAPVEWFSTLKNFEQVKASIEAGEDIANWCSWDALEPGILVQLSFYNRQKEQLPIDGVSAVMWGLTLLP